MSERQARQKLLMKDVCMFLAAVVLALSDRPDWTAGDWAWWVLAGICAWLIVVNAILIRGAAAAPPEKGQT